MRIGSAKQNPKELSVACDEGGCRLLPVVTKEPDNTEHIHGVSPQEKLTRAPRGHPLRVSHDTSGRKRSTLHPGVELGDELLAGELRGGSVVKVAHEAGVVVAALDALAQQPDLAKVGDEA